MDKEKTIIQRFDAVKAWMEQRVEAGLQEKPQFNSDPWLRHVRSVFRHLGEAAFHMKDKVDEFASGPLSVMISQRTLEKAIVFEVLIVPFEKLMEGKVTSENMVTSIYENAKSSVMRGYDVALNSTNPLANVAAIARNQLNCALMQTINSSITYEAERAKEKA